jgi:hypothetical protein
MIKNQKIKDDEKAKNKLERIKNDKIKLRVCGYPGELKYFGYP